MLHLKYNRSILFSLFSCIFIFSSFSFVKLIGGRSDLLGRLAGLNDRASLIEAKRKHEEAMREQYIVMRAKFAAAEHNQKRVDNKEFDAIRDEFDIKLKALAVEKEDKTREIDAINRFLNSNNLVNVEDKQLKRKVLEEEQRLLNLGVRTEGQADELNYLVQLRERIEEGNNGEDAYIRGQVFKEKKVLLDFAERTKEQEEQLNNLIELEKKLENVSNLNGLGNLKEILETFTSKSKLEEISTKKKEELENLQREIDGFDWKAKADDDTIAKLTKEDYEFWQKGVKRTKAELGGFKGDIFFRGIAGKDWQMVEDLKVGDDIWEGVKNGVMLRLSLSIGNSIGTRIDGYVGEVFGAVFGKFEEVVTIIYRHLFHAGCKPFTPEELGNWEKLVCGDFFEIEKMMRDAGKNDSRGKAEILREYEGEGRSLETVNLWQDFVEDAAQTCLDLAEEIEKRNGYYKKRGCGFDVTNCADRLRNKLIKVSNWLLRVKSLKDFANVAEAKAIIPAMNKSLMSYFKNLAEQAKPSQQAKGAATTLGKTSYQKPDNYGYGNYGGMDSYGGGYPSYPSGT